MTLCDSWSAINGQMGQIVYKRKVSVKQYDAPWMHVTQIDIANDKCSLAVSMQNDPELQLLFSRMMYAMMNEKKRKQDYAFWRQFNEKPSIIPGCPGNEEWHCPWVCYALTHCRLVRDTQALFTAKTSVNLDTSSLHRKSKCRNAWRR